MINNVILNNDSMKLEDFLKNNYEILWDSIEDEEYTLDFQTFDEFYEIKRDDEVIGYIVFEYSNMLNVKEIVDAYILPDCRGDGLLCENLIEIIESTHYKILSKKPTRSFIQALLKSGLACKISDNQIFSWIKFDVNIGDAYKNSKLKRLYKKASPEKEKVPYFADLFDLDINCLLFNDYQHNFSKKSETLIISEPRKYDLKKYNCRKKLKNVTVNYLKATYENYSLNIDDALESFEELNDRIGEKYTVENMIGSEDKLNDSIVDLLTKSDLTIDDGFKIRESILNSLETCEISNISIKDRLTFLISNPSFIGKKVEKENLNKCSFCGEEIRDLDIEYCNICGHLFDVLLENFNLIEENEEMSLDELEFIENAQPIKDNEFLTEMYNMSKKVIDINNIAYDDLNYTIDEYYEHLDELLDNIKDYDFDWYFPEDNQFDNELLKIIDKNNYDEDEVQDAQKRIEIYEFVKHVNENITSWKMPLLIEMNHFDFDYNKYAENEGYVEKINANEFAMYFDVYPTDELKQELKHFDITPKNSRKDILNQFQEYGDYSYIITEKGLEYLKSYPLLDFFSTHLHGFIFYEFEKYYYENKDEISLEEIGKNYVTNEFKQAVKQGKLDVYLKYAFYYYSINFNKGNYDEALYYLIQRIIYEINTWYSQDNHYPFEFAISPETASYFTNFYHLDIYLDLEEIFNRAFNEFKFGHMKNNKEKIYEYCEILLSGTHVIEINDEMFFEYHLNKIKLTSDFWNKPQ